jgi:hypothetical protein
MKYEERKMWRKISTVYLGLATLNVIVGYVTESYYHELADTLSEDNIAAYSVWTEDNVEAASPL